MPYRNKAYVSMDADNDIRYYRLMCAWKQSDHSSFSFNDAHDLNNIYDKSEASIKAGLLDRFRNTKVFVLLIGTHTRYLYKFVRWEIEQAIKRELPIIIVNINGRRDLDPDRCPPIVKDELAIHISFNAKILEHALTHWPSFHESAQRQGKSGSYHYQQSVYNNLSL